MLFLFWPLAESAEQPPHNNHMGLPCARIRNQFFNANRINSNQVYRDSSLNIISIDPADITPKARFYKQNYRIKFMYLLSRKSSIKLLI